MQERYEQVIRNVCMLSDWKKASYEEKEGAIGVACTLAFIKGIPANISALSKHLKIHPKDIEIPFKRLLINSVFSSKYNIKEDEVLLGSISNKDSSKYAWCTISGIASGFCGLRENTTRY